jgi:hypothetical protein
MQHRTAVTSAFFLTRSGEKSPSEARKGNSKAWQHVQPWVLPDKSSDSVQRAAVRGRGASSSRKIVAMVNVRLVRAGVETDFI